MLSFLNKPVYASIFIYIVSLFVLYVTKPSLCFDENNEIKTFGCTRKNNTLFTFYIIAGLISIVTYFCLSMKSTSLGDLQTVDI